MKNFSPTRLVFLMALAAVGLVATCGREGPDGPPDLSPPFVGSTSPFYQEQGVPIDASIAITFSEAMDPSSLNSESLQVRRGDNNAAVSGTISCNGSVATFKPGVNLSANAPYNVTVGVGAKDIAGNAMTAPYVFPFTTGSGTGNPGPTHTVTATVSGGGGSISPGTATVSHGGTASFTVTPDANYHIASVTGCGGKLSGTTYITGGIRGDCTITASFIADAPTTHAVTVMVGPGGSVTPSGPTLFVREGETIKFDIDAGDKGFVSVNSTCGGELRGDRYETERIVEDCRVEFSFHSIEWTVTPVAVGNGRLIPGTPQIVSNNGNTNFTVEPDPSSTIASVTGCEGSLSSETNTYIYTTGSITADCTVIASFADAPETSDAGDDLAAYSTEPIIANCTAQSGFSEDGLLIPDTPRLVHFDEASGFTFKHGSGFAVTPAAGCRGPLTYSPRPTCPFTARCPVAGYAGGSILTVTPSPGENGKMVPARPQQVAYNKVVSFKIIPAEGYSIAYVSGCGGILRDNIYTTGPVRSDCTVTAVFSQSYSI